MKLDAHVHTYYSGYSTIGPLRRIMRESYNTPESVYVTAKRRGMDLVTVTDHDQISGALELAGHGVEEFFDMSAGRTLVNLFSNRRATSTLQRMLRFLVWGH